jgi:hypothetical protein
MQSLIVSPKIYDILMNYDEYFGEKPAERRVNMGRYRPKLVGKADTKFGHLVNIKNLFMAGAYKWLQREIKMLKEV